MGHPTEGIILDIYDAVTAASWFDELVRRGIEVDDTDRALAARLQSTS